MTVLTNSLEGGTNGTTITTANSGGTSGNAADTVNHSSGTLQFSSSAAMHGSLGFVAATGATATNESFEWNTSLGTVTTHYGRAYIKLSAAPGSNDAVVFFENSSGTFAGGIQVTTGRVLSVQNASFGTAGTFTTAMTVGTYYRIEWELISSTTVGQIVLNLYVGDSATATETHTYTSQNFGANCAHVMIGWPSGQHASQPSTSFDDVGLSTTGFLGPASTTTVPGAPTAVSGTPGNAQVALTWTAPASNGGSAITGYTVIPQIAGVNQTPVNTGSTSTSFTVTGLTNGTAYTFEVEAINAIGAGAASSPSSAVTPSTVPGAPTIGAVTAGVLSAVVNWTAPASNGGSAITGYTVTPFISGVAQTATTVGVTTSATITGLTGGTAYTFKVAAINANGTGAQSAASSAVTPTAATFDVPPTEPDFPDDELNPSVEMLIAGDWTDVSTRVFQDTTTIQRGHPDESTTAAPSTFAGTFDNSDGLLSSLNPSSQYYGQLGLNTNLRLSIPASNTHLRCELDVASGMTTPTSTAIKALSHNSTGFELWIDADADNWYAPQVLAAQWATSTNQRSWILNAVGDGTLQLIVSSTGTRADNSTTWYLGSFTKVPKVHGRLSLRVVYNAATTSAAFYYGQFCTGWTLMGSGGWSTVTDCFQSSAPLSLGFCPDQSEYPEAGFQGKIYAFAFMPSGGSPSTSVATADFTSMSPGASSFVDPQGNTWSLASTGSSSSVSQPPIGVFRGRLGQWVSNGNAATLTSMGTGYPPTSGVPLSTIQKYETFLGRTVQYVLDFMIEAPTTWSEFETGAVGTVSGTPQPLNGWGSLGTRKLLLGVTACAGASIGSGGATWAAEAAGTNDAHWTALGNYLISNGYSNACLRIGREMNGNWYPWAVTSSNLSSYISGYRHIVTLLRGLTGANFTFMWNPYLGIGNSGSGISDFSTAYPGDAYVDQIGLDVYDGGYTAEGSPWLRALSDQMARFASQQSQTNGLTFWKSFAASHSKPLSFPEWGLQLWNATGTSYTGGGDNAYFINSMASGYCQSAGMHALWEHIDNGVSDPDADTGRNGLVVPNSRAAFLAAFSPTTVQVSEDFPEISGRDYRFYGECAAWPQSWTPGDPNARMDLSAGGLLRRLGSSNQPTNSVMYRAYTRAPASDAIKAYWPMEDVAGSTQLASALGGTAMTFTFLTQLAQFSGFPSSLPVPTLNNGYIVGTLPPYTVQGTPGIGSDAIVRFLANVPATGETVGANSVICRVQFFGGSIGYIDWIMPTATTLQCVAYAPTGAVLWDSGAFTPGGPPTQWYGAQMRCSIEVRNLGSGNISVYAVWVNPGDSGIGGEIPVQTGAAGSVGAVSKVIFNPLKGLVQTSVGHCSVQTTYTNLFDMQAAVNAYAGELAGVRFQRICGEEGISFRSMGNILDTAVMGIQTVETVANILQECADCDMGMWYEPRQTLGWGYRTRNSLGNQSQVVAFDYDQDHLSDTLEPTIDDQTIKNDITVTAQNSGSSARQTLDDGSPMSVGVAGRYDTQITINTNEDSQLVDEAGYLLYRSTVNEPRYKAVNVDLANRILASMFWTVLEADVGDRLCINNPPIWLPPDQVDQIYQGVQEDISRISLKLSWNGIPTLPWNVAYLDDVVYCVLDTDGSTLVTATDDGTLTSLSVATTTSGSPLWGVTGDSRMAFPFDINIGGERITVTGITGSSSPQTFTVTRSVNGVVKAQAAGADVSTWTGAILSIA